MAINEGHNSFCNCFFFEIRATLSGSGERPEERRGMQTGTSVLLAAQVLWDHVGLAKLRPLCGCLECWPKQGLRLIGNSSDVSSLLQGHSTCTQGKAAGDDVFC